MKTSVWTAGGNIDKALLISAAMLVAGGAHAAVLPQGPVVAGATSGVGATFNYGVANALTVNQSAARVVIDWQSFSIGRGGTVTFNQASPSWIAFNRVDINPATGISPLSTISGTLGATGGVWLFSTGGILLGPTAVVDVGSFAGVTGPLNAAGGLTQLLNPGPGGLTTVGIGAPTGAGVETIDVQSGAQITAATGFVVLQSETMAQNGAVTAFDGIDYTVSESGRIVFTTSSAGQRLQSADAVIVPGQDRPSFSHGGVTDAAWVGIDTPGGALRSGYHGLVNLDGEIEASGVKPGTTDGVVLLIGGDQGPAYPGYTGSSIGLDASGGVIRATEGMSVTTDSATLGAVTIGGALDVDAYGAITLAGAASVGGSALIGSGAGAVAFDANFSASQAVTANAQTILVGPNVTVHSDSAGAGAGALILSSAGDITADPSSLLIGGADAAVPTSAVTVRAGAGAQGGNIVLGEVSASRVFVQSQSRGSGSEGNITLAGDVLGSQGITVLVNDVGAAGTGAGDLRVQGAVTSAGLVDIENLGPGLSAFGPGAEVTSTGNQVFLYSGGDTTLAGGAKLSGVSLLDHTLGTLTVASGATIATTGSAAAPVSSVIPYGSEFTRQSGLNLAAGNMIIQGSVRAGATASPGDIYIEVLGNPGATAVIGGAGGATGFDLSNASFANLGGRNIVIMGGPGEATAPGANLDVQDLTLDSSKLSALWLGTSSTRSITVSGAVTPTGPGAVNVDLGFARLGLGGSYAGGAVTNPGAGGLDGFVPGEIDVTGGLGAAGATLGSVTLIARNDILMGAPAFITAAQTNSSFDAATRSASFPGSTPDHLFVAAGALQMAAQGRIVEQNSPGAGFLYAGLDLAAPTAVAPLIFVPTALEGQPIGGGAWTADYAPGPTAIDLFGILRTASGARIDDVAAATQPDLLDAGISTRAAYFINTCAFGAACGSSASILTFQPPELTIASVDGATQGAEGAAAGAQALASTSATAVDVVPALTSTAISLQQDDERLGAANPITETGNGDLSSGPDNACPPQPEPGKDCLRP